MLLGLFLLNFVQLLIIMSLIKVDEVVVLGVVLIGNAVVNSFLIRYFYWNKLRWCDRSDSNRLRIRVSDNRLRRTSITIMEDLLSCVLSSLLERGPLKCLVMLLEGHMLTIIIVIYVVSKDCLLLIRVVMTVVVLILSDV